MNLFQPPAGLLGDQEEAIRQQMQMQGLLGLAAGLFEAGTPSRTPVSLGGSAIRGLMAGQQMASDTFTQALKAQALRQQMAEREEKRQREQQLRTAIEKSYETRPVAGLGLGAEQIASPITQAEFESFGPQAFMQAAATVAPTERGINRDKLLSAIAQFDPTKYLELTQPKEPKESFRLLTKEEKKKNNLPLDEQFQVSSSGKISPVSGTLVKNIVGGQSGLDNEMKIRDAFKGEPVYKGYQETQTAYKQITESLKQASPAGDLAAATKFMKLLDPGSVVRESELYMAMQASGALDRFTNYATNVIQGTKLTPTQRQDFSLLANKLYAASVEAYNRKRNEYAGFAQEYGLNPNRAVGAPATFSKNIKVDY